MAREPLPAFDLRAARKARKLSQVKVAEILCTSQPSVARWESNGNLPAIYRKAWAAHWQLEETNNVTVRAPKRKANLSNVSAGDKANDSRPNKRSRKSSKSRSETRRRAERARSSSEGLSESEAGSKSEGSTDTAV